MTSNTRTRRIYKDNELTNAIKTILSPTQPLTRADVSIKLGGCIKNERIRKALNQLVEDGEVLRHDGHPNTYLKASEDGTVYFSIRGKPRARG